MSLSDFFSPFNISASGLSAERVRMDVVAQNIANSEAVDAATGKPYRRREVMFRSEFDSAMGRSSSGHGLSGVTVDDVIEDPSEFRLVFKGAGHPHADENGFVEMPNVDVAFEMVDLMTASRAYEANLVAMKSFREMMDRTLSILR